MEVPKLRFKGFHENWGLRKMKNFLTIGSGKDYKHLSHGNVPVFGTGGIMTMVDDFLYEGDTVCIGRKGTIDKPLFFQGKIWTVDTLFYTHSFKDVLPYFVYLLFQNVNWKKHNEAGGVPSLTKKTIEEIEFKLPKIEEQQKIADFLQKADERIAILKEKKELLERYKKGVMQKIFSQELRFKDDDGNEFPEWEERALGEIGDTINGLTYSPSNIAATGTLVLRSSNIKGRTINFDDCVYVNVDSYNPVISNDILICVRNGSKNLIGKNTLIKEEHQGMAFGAFMTVFRSNFNKFLFHLFSTDSYYKKIDENLGARINSINNNELKKFKFKLPSIKEQEIIADFLDGLDNKIDVVQNQIKQMEIWKKGLLQQMFV